MIISNVLNHLKVKFTIRGDKEYSPDIRLEDLDIELEREVTNEEFHKAAEDLVEHKRKTKYKRERVKEYPAVSEQLDAIVKAIDKLRNVVELPEDSLKVIDECLAVKARHPKGE